MNDEVFFSGQQLWTNRPYLDEDRDFIIYTLLASHRYSPEGLAMNAHKEASAQKRYWLGHEKLAARLIERCEIVVAEAESEGSRVIVGYTIGEGDKVLHYVLTRRRFQRLGVCRDLLEPFMAHGGEVLYSHRPSVRGLQIPKQWKYSPYEAWKWML